jgi:manganese/iron transport system permease protein
MIIGAVALSVVSVWLGLVISYHAGTAASATMALIPVVLFFALLPVSGAVHRRRQSREQSHRSAATTPAGAGR